VLFRAALEALIDAYRKAGGLTGFALDYADGIVDPQRGRLLSRALQEIATAIRSGPVTYAGGALASGRVFRYDVPRRLVILPAAMWRELSLLGHWIGDAVVLRWAELSERLGRSAGIRAQEVVELLLTRPESERETHLARVLYGQKRDLRCVWTERPLRAFDVDHVIPFALWGNNDLWNLVIASPRANNAKRDALPSRALLDAAKERVIDCWQYVRNEASHRFDLEAARMLGAPVARSGWENALFARLRESVEVTALQRGVPRWQPDADGYRALS
jgi:hypothetical protein